MSSVASQTAGYGIDSLLLIANADAITCNLVFTQKLDVTGRLSIEHGVDVTAEGASALSDSGSWAPSLKIDGILTLHNCSNLRFDGPQEFGRFGKLHIKADDEPIVNEPQSVALPDYPSTVWATVLPNTSLQSLTNVTATASGTWFGEGWSLTPYHFTNDGAFASCQLQLYDSRYVKCVIYKFRQYGGDVQACVQKACYYETAKDERGIDMTPNRFPTMNVFTNGTANGYGLKNIRVALDGAQSAHGIALAGKCTDNGYGEITIEGRPRARMVLQLLNTLVCRTPFSVEQGGVVQFSPTNSAYGTYINKSFSIAHGGELWQTTDWSISVETADITISGGTVRYKYDLVQNDSNANTYIGNVSFTDGGLLTGLSPRWGYYGDKVIRVTGTHPATVNCSLGAIGHDSEWRTLTFDVADVTGNDDADLLLNGRLFYIDAARVFAHLEKTGEGTVRALGRNTVTNRPLAIKGGTWQLAASALMDADNDVDLAGSTLAVEANCTNALGTLSVNTNTVGKLVLGTAAELNLAAFAPADGATLAVTASTDARVRIGTTKCLTSAVRARISLNGGKAFQTCDGYLTDRPDGTMVLMR